MAANDRALANYNSESWGVCRRQERTCTGSHQFVTQTEIRVVNSVRCAVLNSNVFMAGYITAFFVNCKYSFVHMTYPKASDNHFIFACMQGHNYSRTPVRPGFHIISTLSFVFTVFFISSLFSSNNKLKGK